LVGDFRQYLIDERGLVASTADEYAWRVRRFLAARVPDGDVERLIAADVTSTVLDGLASMSVVSMHHLVFALRSFLRFCYLEGLIDADLSAAALMITGRRRSSLPKGVSRADADALVGSCDRRRAIGRRDYAVLLTLLRLGLRAGEVATLTLDDFDWRAGEVVVHGKGGRLDRLPLPADVGEAIVGYLQRGRPSSEHRELFLRALAPTVPLTRSGVSWIVRLACRRAGTAEVGAHRLRHTAACEMVAAGVPLPEIGAVLRHRSIASTALYARVDLDALRSVALPWPGGDLQ
jgi:integrase